MDAPIGMVSMHGSIADVRIATDAEGKKKDKNTEISIL